MMRVASLLALAAAVAGAQTVPPAAAPAARKPAAASALAPPSYKDLKYPALRPIATPAADSVTLPDGMEVLLLENHELPLVNGMVLVHTGSAYDPPEKIGLAALTQQVLLEGDTLNRPPGQGLTRRFRDLGADLSADLEHNHLSISFSVIKQNSDAVLDALKDGLTAPEFSQERIDLVKASMRTAIEHRNDDGAGIVRREFAATVYGKNSPYGAYPENATIERINRGDVVDFYRRYFFPKNVMLAMEGDFDAARMKTRLEALFEDWTSDQPSVPPVPQADTDGAPGRYIAVRKDALHAYFSIGQMSGEYLDKDEPALEIMADILGGGPQGRLNQRLHGQVDGLTAAWTPGLGHPGLFAVSGAISNQFFTTKAIAAVNEELNKIRTEPVSEQELKTAKAAAVNSLVFAVADPFAVLPSLAQYRFFHFPEDYMAAHQRALESVTRDDVLRVARAHLGPAKMTVLVAGNPVGFEAPLESLGGTVTALDLTIAAPKPEAALGDAVSHRSGKQMLAHAQEAMGGVDKLAAVTDYTSEIDYRFDASVGGTQAHMTERWLAPSYLRQDNTTGSSKVSVFCDGRGGWIANGQGGSNALTGVQLKQVQNDVFRVLFPLLLSDRAPNRTVNALDDQTVEVSDTASQIARLAIDPATGLLRNVMYDAFTVNGMVSVLETYSEYRDISGIKLPSKIAISISGVKYQDLTIRSIRINTGLNLQELAKRP